MITEAQWLLQQIMQTPQPKGYGVAVVLSAWDEDPEEQSARDAEVIRLGVGNVFRPECRNTHEEAIYVLGILTDEASFFWSGDIPPYDITIVTSAYHQLRAFLTFVKVFQGTSVRLWNAPAPSGWEKFEGELRKIEEYQAKGHVATYREGLDHLVWRDAYHCVGA